MTSRPAWIETIIVALGEAGVAGPALAVAKSLARGMAVPLHLLYATDHAVPVETVPKEYLLSPEDLMGTILEGVIGKTPEGVVREIGRFPGPLLVTTMDALPEQRLDPLSQAVLDHPDFPILLVPRERGNGDWKPREILLPYDGSPEAASALEPVVDLARWADSTLAVLHVSGQRTRGGQPPGTLRVPRFIDYPQHDWPEWAKEFLDRLRVQGSIPPDIDVRLQLAVGTPGEEVVGWTRNHASDLVVVSWRGDIGPGRAATLKAVIDGTASPLLCLPVLKGAPRGV